MIYTEAFDSESESYWSSSYGTFKDSACENKGGLILAHWDGTTNNRIKIREETKATIDVFPCAGGKRRRFVFIQENLQNKG